MGVGKVLHNDLAGVEYLRVKARPPEEVVYRRGLARVGPRPDFKSGTINLFDGSKEILPFHSDVAERVGSWRHFAGNKEYKVA